ncbi:MULTISPECIES: DUF664 domain-containing protein [unclassified Streptomyces]|uniref:mycothiol transferase n=1 Tax=unclassified Streptomyces TaxID=2593676 RepID=UPI000961A0DB|nr:hypothetical protein A6A29_10420 [Streptomyces sp. TSRI0281]
MTTSTDSPATFPPGERGELLRALAEQRELLLITVRGITDTQAMRRTTVSELTLGGIVKHVTPTPRKRGGFSLCLVGVAMDQPGP